MELDEGWGGKTFQCLFYEGGGTSFKEKEGGVGRIYLQLIKKGGKNLAAAGGKKKKTG